MGEMKTIESTGGGAAGAVPGRGGWRAMARRPLRAPSVRTLAVGVAIGFALDYSLLLLLGDSLVETLVASEDGIVENAGAAAFLGASILFGVAYARARRLAHLVLALAFFLGAGEELAWGQHALGFGTPAAYERWNAQGEVTIHNLVFIQRGSYVPVDIVEVLFFVFAIVYTVLLPLLGARSAAARRALARRVPIVPGAFGALLLANLALLALAGLLSSADRSHPVLEVGETGFAVLFLAVALDAARARAPGSGARTGGRAASASLDPVE